MGDVFVHDFHEIDKDQSASRKEQKTIKRTAFYHASRVQTCALGDSGGHFPRLGRLKADEGQTEDKKGTFCLAKCGNSHKRIAFYHASRLQMYLSGDSRGHFLRLGRLKVDKGQNADKKVPSLPANRVQIS